MFMYDTSSRERLFKDSRSRFHRWGSR